jgi:inactivated superfamily I helicase
VLESRVLDFDTVIVTSMNEGSFLPENRRIRSFRMMKRELIAHIQRERRNLYLSFYHLLQRAKKTFAFITPKVKDWMQVKKSGLSPVRS